MNPFELRWLRGLALALAITLVLSACETGPQEPTIRLAQVAREVAGTEVRWQQAEPAEVGLRVWRDGQELRAARGMLLQRGDVVQTGPQSAAVIRFSGGNTGAATGTTTLAENTRVRLGSLEVLFGRVFANLRGIFETSSENIVAGVEGTRFLFEVRPDRSVAIAVAEGVVACRARQGGWAPVRLHALEALVSAYPNRTPPRVMPADARELRDAAAWAASVAEAPSPGWCCVDGRVVPSWSNRCGGNAYSTNRSVAESMCRPAPLPLPAQTGWCCAHGEVYPSSREQCAGSFSESAGVARRMCMPRKPPPPPPSPPILR